MKISIITPVYRERKQFDKFLKDIQKQTNKNFELVLIIDTNNEKNLEAIDKLPKDLKKKVKVVFNSKRTTRSQAIDQGVKVATGKYSVIMSISNHFHSDMVKKIQDVLKTKQADIIEFRGRFKDPIKFDGKIRKSFNKPVKISEHKEIFAYSFPFDFNKIYKTSLLKEVAKFEYKTKLNSRFSIEHAYKALLSAETYVTVNQKIISSKAKMSNNFNPLKMIRQWDDMIHVIKNNFSDINSTEFIYAQYFTEVVFMSAMVKSTRNSVLTKKFNEKIKKQQQTTFENFFEQNPYANAKLKEARILRENNKLTSFPKIIKEI